MNEDCEIIQEIKNQTISKLALCKNFVKYTVTELVASCIENARKFNKTEQETGSATDWNQGDIYEKRAGLTNNTAQTYQPKTEFVWIQAYAINVSEDCDTLQLSDSLNNKSLTCPIDFTSSVLIVNCKSAPGGISELTKGNYCQVLGQVLGFEKAHGYLRVSAIKTADLTKLANCEVLKSMWPKEIIEARMLEKRNVLF